MIDLKKNLNFALSHKFFYAGSLGSLIHFLQSWTCVNRVLLSVVLSSLALHLQTNLKSSTYGFRKLFLFSNSGAEENLTFKWVLS